MGVYMADKGGSVRELTSSLCDMHLLSLSIVVGSRQKTNTCTVVRSESIKARRDKAINRWR
jgi:hypothetical protein